MTEIFRTCGLIMTGCSVLVLLLGVLADLACYDRIKNICCILAFVFGMSAAVFAGIVH